MAACSVPEECDVVVVGAGVAGLRCGNMLRDMYGITNVLVLEAADYVGGRIKQDRHFLKGKDVEVGAEFVHGESTLLSTLARQHGWRMWWLCIWAQGDGGPSEEPAPDGGHAYYYLGHTKRLCRMDELDDEHVALNETLAGIGELPKEEVSGARGRRHLEQYLKEVGFGAPHLLAMAEAGFSNTAGGRSKDFSVANLARFEAMYVKDGDDKDARFEPSFAVVIDELKRRLAIRKQWPVTSIAVHVTEDGGEGVIVTSQDGRVVRARCAVVTVPLPVLQDGDITFTPPLLPSKQAALECMRMPDAAKVMLKFRARAWPEDCHGVICAGCFVPEMWTNQTVTPATPVSPDARPCTQEFMLTAFACGANCDAWKALPRADLIRRVLAQVDAVFSPGARRGSVSAKHDYPRPSTVFVDAAVHFWSDAPYVRGAYTGPTTSEGRWTRAELQRCHAGRVFFAGEACSGAHPELDSPSTVHGAMATGDTAAKDVAALLQAPLRARL